MTLLSLPRSGLVQPRFCEPCATVDGGEVAAQLIRRLSRLRVCASYRQEHSMPEQISALRQRMMDGMSVCNMAALTQAAYVRAVKNFSKHFGKSPDKLTFEDVRQYQLSLVNRRLGPQAVNQIMCALRFFYKTTMGIKDAHDHIALARRYGTLPAILSREEVGRFLQAIRSVKHRIAFAAIYAAGLRVSELTSLTVKDIDSTRMVIHVRQGKGRKDRYVMLSDQLLDLLRSHWKIDRPSHWLFPGADPQRHITARARLQENRGRAAGDPPSPAFRCGAVREYLLEVQAIAVL